MAVILLLTIGLTGCASTSSTSGAKPVPVLETPRKARDAVQKLNERTKSVEQAVPTADTESSR